MRRIVVALFAMITGTALLVGLKSQSLAVPFGFAEGPVDPDLGAGDPPGTSGAPEATGTAGPTAPPGATPPGGATGTTATTTNPSTTAPPAQVPTTNAPPAVNGTFTGAAVAVKNAQSPNTKSGQCGDCHNYSMSVTITVSNGQITKATVAYNTSPGASQRYADKATNTLSPKILTAQTWRLGNVSGATYSANAFELSVKDAMTRAGLPT